MPETIKNKILIIEDEALVARELSSRLKKIGYEVVGIAYGNEGIELARKTKPDLLLSDIHLKDGEDGIEMAKIIRAERDVPVVFLTAYSDEDTVSRAKAIAPYGYIIKPAENRELQIAIEMALYKFSIENELRETQQLLQNALTCIGSALVFIDKAGKISQFNQDAEKVFNLTRSDAVNKDWQDIFNLSGSVIQNKISAALLREDVVKLPPFILHVDNKNACLLDGVVGPMEAGGVLILRALTEISDPIEMMAPPGELMAQVDDTRLSPTESLMCQLLISPGQDVSGMLIEETSQLLNQMLRSTDLVSIYGTEQLSVSMPYTSLADGEMIADQLLAGLASHFARHGGEFSIGLAYSAPGDQQPFELFRRASWALKLAQESGGGRVITWDEKSEELDHLSGSDSEKQREYRNLVLLWNVLNIVSKSDTLVEVSEKLCSHLVRSFDLSKASVLANRNEAIELIAGVDRLSTVPNQIEVASELTLGKPEFDKAQALLTTGADFSELGGSYFFRLTSEKLLHLEVRSALEPVDIEFLKNLVAYFATGLNRFELSRKVIDEGLDKGRLIYQSASMMSIMQSLDLVAPTDATVLIAGESGTGKELLARTIHDKSERADKPFIIVDCGAVVGSLIESELFGHVRGAFTGADSTFSGRLKEADGGTVLLDEIGELPLDVQVKLLRFVQDREIAAVGSSRYETVDTRIVAATNRDLKSLVDEGGFREDLYYRLNVFTVEAPPLRERIDDILLLAQHYLGIYRERYKKNISDFTVDAKQALIQYPWPGNIRELINIINRGVILCRDSRLSTIHLGIFPSTGELGEVVENDDPEAVFEAWLKNQVDASLKSNKPLDPLGQWLEEDIIIKSMSFNSEILNRAALSLGIPESTLRRKVSRLRKVYGENKPPRPTEWDAYHELLKALIVVANKKHQNVFDLVSGALLKELEKRPLNRKDAASLMGVSLPTYRRLMAISSNISPY